MISRQSDCFHLLTQAKFRFDNRGSFLNNFHSYSTVSIISAVANYGKTGGVYLASLRCSAPPMCQNFGWEFLSF